MMSTVELAQPSIKRSVSFEDHFDIIDECQTPLRRVGRSKSGLELEFQIDRRAQEVQELLLLGQATLEEESMVQEPGRPETPAKRRRCVSESWELLFDYADEVSTQLQCIDRKYRSMPNAKPQQDRKGSDKYVSSQRYDVPMELLFLADAPLPATQKLSLARTKQKLCKASSGNKKEKALKSTEENLTATAALSDETRRFWPEVDKLKRDMRDLRAKLQEAKAERSRTGEQIREFQEDLSKVEASRLPVC